MVFGYACHNTTLGIQQWNGDYAGFAESNLEQAQPGAVALFFMGCGADQNPIPRRTVELAHKYGEMVSSAVQAVLAGKMESLPPKLRDALRDSHVESGGRPDAGRTDRPGQRANGLHVALGDSAAQGTRRRPAAASRTYPYPIEVWELGGKQLWIALGGEVVVDYALHFKDRYGADNMGQRLCQRRHGLYPDAPRAQGRGL